MYLVDFLLTIKIKKLYGNLIFNSNKNNNLDDL